MNKTLLFFIFIVIIIIGALAAVYIFFEKPKQDESKKIIEQVALNVYTFDKYNNTQIMTGIEVLKNNQLMYNGTTVEGGALFLNVSVNNSYTIKTFNLNNQVYYTSWKDLSYFGTGFGPQRIELQLAEPGDLEYNIEENYYYYSGILNLTSKNRDIEDVFICVKWSVNIISIELDGMNFELVPSEKFGKYKNYDKCYKIGRITKENPKLLSIAPKAYMDKTDRDFIEIMVMDRDCYKNDCQVGNNDIDYGMKDVQIIWHLFKLS